MKSRIKPAIKNYTEEENRPGRQFMDVIKFIIEEDEVVLKSQPRSVKSIFTALAGAWRDMDNVMRKSKNKRASFVPSAELSAAFQQSSVQVGQRLAALNDLASGKTKRELEDQLARCSADLHMAQRHHGVDQVVAHGLGFGRVVAVDAPRLHQRGVQVQVVRHHGGANDADGHHQAGAVQTRHEAGCHVGPNRPCQQHLNRQASTNRHHQGGDQSFKFADAIALQQDDQHHVNPGDQRTPGQRNAKQQVERNRAAQQLSQITGHDGGFTQHPQGQHHRPCVVFSACLCQIQPAGDAQPRRQALQQHGDQVGRQQHPHQLVAEARAPFQVGGPVTRVHVAHADHDRRAAKPQGAPASWRAHVHAQFEVGQSVVPTLKLTTAPAAPSGRSSRSGPRAGDEKSQQAPATPALGCHCRPSRSAPPPVAGPAVMSM